MVFSTQTVTPCGMDRGVVPLAPVVPSTHHHGSMYNYPPPQLMTSRSESVLLMELQEVMVTILQYNSWNSMRNELDMTNPANKLESLEFVASVVE